MDHPLLFDFGGMTCPMGTHHDIVQHVKGIVGGRRSSPFLRCRRIGVPDIQPSGMERTVAQGMVERGLVHDLRPADIDKNGALGQQTKLGSAEQAAGVWCERQAQDEDGGVREQGCEMVAGMEDDPVAGLNRRLALANSVNVHAETEAGLGHPLPNGAIAQDEGGCAREHQRRIGLPEACLPVLPAQQPIRREHALGRREQQRQRHLGDG